MQMKIWSVYFPDNIYTNILSLDMKFYKLKNCGQVHTMVHQNLCSQLNMKCARHKQALGCSLLEKHCPTFKPGYHDIDEKLLKVA